MLDAILENLTSACSPVFLTMITCLLYVDWEAANGRRTCKETSELGKGRWNRWRRGTYHEGIRWAQGTTQLSSPFGAASDWQVSEGKGRDW